MLCHVAGVVPITTADIDDLVCTAVFFAGCNFRCPFCFSSDILDFKQDFSKDIRIVKQQIERNFPFVDAVLFCGGEPTLQKPVLINLAAFAKEKGMKVAIETNGSKPNVLRELLDKHLVDYIILDLKSPLNTDNMTKTLRPLSTFFFTIDDILASIKETMALLKKRRDDVGLIIRTTVVPMLTYRKEHFLEMAYDIKDLDAVWELRPFVNASSVVSPRFKETNPPSSEFLRGLKKVCLAEYPDMRIRIKRYDTDCNFCRD
ncbi:anaerobic ribonucleoside-triphosphate reductase activating protein [Candidatus Woesearchaeota archaeon CG11_big_fil_rev_8_21_14_0_20_43_8]|nr:MAG: anaerobic ribonucleoside-triphosphate reductase activating protein [Candidatus Woesearchaeota archaeon CG11_big_fil_rev_8_21_14_0_20_43_8]